MVERRRAERVRRGHLGAVLHLPGLQRTRRLDAHVERRGQHRRVPRDRSSKKGDGFSTSTATKSGRSRTTRSPCRTRPAAGMAQKEFTVYRTHHGPIVREADGKWVSVRLMQEPVKALTQSYTRTKAKNYQAFREIDGAAHELVEQHDLRRRRRQHRATSTPTSSRSAIRSSTGRKPVDGSDPATEWNGVHSIDESPNVLQSRRPAGSTTRTTGRGRRRARTVRKRRTIRPTSSAAPRIARGIHAIRVLEEKKDFTMETLLAAAYDSYLPAFETHDPGAGQGVGQARRRQQSTQGEARRADRAAAQLGLPLVGGVGADVAGRVSGAKRSAPRCRAAREAGMPVDEFIVNERDAQINGSRRSRPPSDKLTRRFRHLEDAVGRDQPLPAAHRRHRAAVQRRGAEHPGRLHVGALGLARVVRRAHVPRHEEDVRHERQQLRRGRRVRRQVRAKAVTAGGQSGDPKSKHFNDQATRYATGDLRDVYFYQDQLQGHTERQYHPGQ